MQLQGQKRRCPVQVRSNQAGTFGIDLADVSREGHVARGSRDLRVVPFECQREGL